MKNDNALLYDSEQERKIVGLFLTGMHNGVFPQCATILTEEDFEDGFCRDVWNVMQALAKDHKQVDMASVMAHAPSMGINLSVTDVATAADNSGRIDSPTEIAAYLANLSTRRRLQHDLMRAAMRLNDLDRHIEDIVADARQAIDNNVMRTDTDVTNMEVYRETVEEWQARANGDSRDGIMTGFHYIDRAGGLQPSDLDIIAGRTSQGKTSLALAMALNAAKAGTAVAFFSLEMSLKQLFMRLTAMESGVASNRLQYSRLDDATFQIAFEHAAKLAPMPIYYDGTRASNIRLIEASIRRMKLNYGIKLAVVDYAQLVTNPGLRERREVVGGSADSLKRLAVELDICVILVSQLRRVSQGESPEPNIAQLKESGNLENAADNIYMVYRPEVYKTTYTDRLSDQWSRYDPKGTGLVIHGKARNTGIGEFMLAFNGELTRWSELTTPPLLSPDDPLLNPKGNEEPPF
ncbi:MAG: AAA family ATPase [Muribaculaceae bacterium]|nr:AAA family ATPase [Muribaculaceae bacterium]